jgi:hypothetical protein
VSSRRRRTSELPARGRQAGSGVVGRACSNCVNRPVSAAAASSSKPPTCSCDPVAIVMPVFGFFFSRNWCATQPVGGAHAGELTHTNREAEALSHEALDLAACGRRVVLAILQQKGEHSPRSFVGWPWRLSTNACSPSRSTRLSSRYTVLRCIGIGQRFRACVTVIPCSMYRTISRLANSRPWRWSGVTTGGIIITSILSIFSFPPGKGANLSSEQIPWKPA